MRKINNEQTKNNNQLQYVDPVAERIFERWIEWDAYKFILLQEEVREFDYKDFLSLIKDTRDYFQQLNTISALSMYSQFSISFSSCLRIMNIMYQYACNKVFVSDCDYDSYEELGRYPLAKLQISIKASQLLTESLCFAVSLIPKEKLHNTIGVIYNSKTIDYFVNVGNMEDIIREVCNCPHSQC